MLRLLCTFAIAITLSSPLKAAPEPEKDDPLGGDPKMDRKIILSAEGIPVGELLAAVSKKTGLAFRADPSVADAKIIVFGPPRPLRAALTDIAALTNDSWRHYTNVEKVEQYVLYREPKAFRYEAGLAQAVTAKMQAKLEEQVRALDERPDQFAKRPEKDWVNTPHPQGMGLLST